MFLSESQVQAQAEAITEEDLRLIQERESSIRQLEVQIRINTISVSQYLLFVFMFTVNPCTRVPLSHEPSVFMLLQADITDINDIFKDLGMMVHEQGDMIGELLSLVHRLLVCSSNNVTTCN